MDKAAHLKTAIKGEMDGYTFYNLLRQKAENPDAKKRLETLRDDERRHGAILVDIYEKIIGGEVGELPSEGVGPLAAIFTNEKYKELKSEQEFISLAIEAELATMKFYKEMASNESDNELKNLFNNLTEEENGHYEILMAEKEALAGNYYWFSSTGTAPMED